MRVILITLIFLLNCHVHLCQLLNVNALFDEINENIVKLNAIAADITWKSSIDPDNNKLPSKSTEYQRKRTQWHFTMCNVLELLQNRHLLNDTQNRQTYLMCRGPKYTVDEARRLNLLYDSLQSTYSDAQICIPVHKNISQENLNDVEDAVSDFIEVVNNIFDPTFDIVSIASKVIANDNNAKENSICVNGEADFEKLMAFTKKEEILRWLWLVWREKVGPTMKSAYEELVRLENKAAVRNRYKDIGVAWRGDLEVPDLRQLCYRLYNRVHPLYSLLHGVVRYNLRRYYGGIVPKYGPIPAHLLGNLWSQSWDSVINIITTKDIDLDASIKKLNWTVLYMVKRAEDFYQSLGLPAMTDTFWRESVFARESNMTRCHGAAADMFQDGDFRLLYCSGVSMQDFYVIHHEMGHIQYYMAYEHQPGLFRQANAALHESIGDTIMYGVMTPQHLHRLSLVNDSILYTDGILYDANTKNQNINNKLNRYLNEGNNQDNKQNFEETNEDQYIRSNIRQSNKYNANLDEVLTSTDDIIMLKQALNKIPQIPFSLVMDEYRWKYFEGGIDKNEMNEVFWNMIEDLSGIAPPIKRSEEYFDVAAKFHVPDNTPFIRYFLGSFIQHQLFEALCKAAIFGRRDVEEDIPRTISMNRCDIYGSKTAGKLLKDIMSRGNSQPWNEILLQTIGQEEISAEALLRYYRPLQNILERFVQKYQIPIGW